MMKNCITVISESKQAEINALFTELAEKRGDLTPWVMARFYQASPKGKSLFAELAGSDLGQLEGSMVEQALFCVLSWYDSPDEIDILFRYSLPHHVDTLNVPLQVFRAFFQALFDEVDDNASKAEGGNDTWIELKTELFLALDGAEALDLESEIQPAMLPL